MKKPESPPPWNNLVTKRIKDVTKAYGDPKVVEISRKSESSYWHWQQMKYIATSKQVDPELVWLLSTFSRMPRFKTLPLYGFGSQNLRFMIPDALQHELMLIDQQLAGGLTSHEDQLPSASQREKFIVSALREEAIASSMLEGAVTTRKEAKQMLKTGRRPRNKGEQMVLNNYQAIQFIREQKNTDLSKEFLLEVHRILTQKTMDDANDVGRFRTDTDDVKVFDERDQEVMHIPPPANLLEKKLKELCAFANQPPSTRNFIHPVVAACILHFQIGFDHPFCDGNGRTARAIFYWMMLRHGYWLFEYLPISRLIYRSPAKYARAFLYCETDHFDITYFLMYNANIIRMARNELQEYIKAQYAQIAQARKLFAVDSRLNYRQQEMVLSVTRSPDRYFTIHEHQSNYDIAYATARNDMLQLAEWGYLKQIQLGNRYEFTAGPNITELD